MYNFQLFLPLLLFNFGTDAQVLFCQNTDNLACECQMNEGLINLAPIGLTNGIQFQSYSPIKYPDDFLYSYNPCYPFTDVTCVDSAVCQKKAPSETYNVGTQKSAKWGKCDDDLSKICVTYEAVQDSTTRTTTVVLTCGTTEKPTLVVDGESPNLGNQYVLRMTSKCACPNGCTGGGDSGLSTGSIMCIIFSVLVVVYVAAGIAFNVFKGAKGKEAFPNVEFWKDFPVKVKDGTVYFVSIFKKGGYETMD